MAKFFGNLHLVLVVGLVLALAVIFAVPANTIPEQAVLRIMAFNVWFIIWPNQKKALGIVPAEDAAKAKAATTAMIFSRTNTLLSLPMLYCMVNFNGG